MPTYARNPIAVILNVIEWMPVPRPMGPCARACHLRSEQLSSPPPALIVADAGACDASKSHGRKEPAPMPLPLPTPPSPTEENVAEANAPEDEDEDEDDEDDKEEEEEEEEEEEDDDDDDATDDDERLDSSSMAPPQRSRAPRLNVEGV